MKGSRIERGDELESEGESGKRSSPGGLPAEATRYFAELLDAAPDPVLVVAPEGEVLYANPPAAKLFGFGGLADAPPFGWPIVTGCEVDIDIVAGGTPRVAAMRASPINWAGREATLASFRDVTDIRRTQADLERSEARFRAAFDSAPAGLAVCDAGGMIARANDSICLMTGFSRHELVGSRLADLVVGAGAAATRHREEMLFSRSLDSFSVDADLERKSGERIPVRMRATWVGADEEERMIIYQVVDLSDRRAEEGRLRFLVEHDDLTGLYSRSAMLRELGRRVAECRRYGDHAGLLLIDLDRFKEFNDRLGHAVGDQVLRAVATAMSDRARSSDMVGRLGGDEFVVLMPRTRRGDVGALAEAMVEAVRDCDLSGIRDNESNEVPGSVRASVGAIEIDGSAGGAGEALQRADEAMYEAKAAGGDRSLVRREPV